MAIENSSIGIIVVASSLAFFGFKIHSDAINFDIKYRGELEDIKRKLSARFRKKTVDLLELIVTDGTNEFTKPVASLNDLQARANRNDLPDKINELSEILASIEKIKNTYRQIRELKKKMEKRFFQLALLVGVNAVLPLLELPQSGGTTNASQMLFLIIILADVLAVLMISDIWNSYRSYSNKEELFLKKLDDVEVDGGDIIKTSTHTSDDEE